MAGEASSPREEVDSDASTPRGETSTSPQATDYLRLEEQESSGPDHGDQNGASTTPSQPKPPAALPPLLRGNLSEDVWAAMPAETRHRLGLPNGLGALNTAVFFGRFPGGPQQAGEARAKTEALATASAALKKVESSRASAERRGKTSVEASTRFLSG